MIVNLSSALINPGNWSKYNFLNCSKNWAVVVSRSWYDNKFLENNKSVIEDDIDYFPVSKNVNNPKNNDENCIKEINL